MAKKYKEITPTFFRFDEKNTQLEGRLVERSTIQINTADVVKYTIENVTTGERTTFLGGRQLDPILDTVKVGQEIKLVYTEKEKTSGGYFVKTFKVYVAEGEEEKPAPKKG